MPNHFSFLVLAAPHPLGNFTVTYLSDHLQKKTQDEASWLKLDGLNVWLKCDVTYNGVQASVILSDAISWGRRGKKAQHHLFLSDSGDTRKIWHIKAAAEIQKETRKHGCTPRTVLIREALTVTLTIQSNLKTCSSTHHADELRGTTGISWEHFDEKVAVTNYFARNAIFVGLWLVGKTGGKLISQKPQTAFLWGGRDWDRSNSSATSS